MKYLCRSVRGVRLIREHFTDVPVHLLAGRPAVDASDWLTVLREFLELVEENWFGVDWMLLDDLYDASVSVSWDTDEDREPDSLQMMAEMLYGIPYRAIRPSVGDIHDDDGLAAVRLIAFLLDYAQIDVDLLVALGVFDGDIEDDPDFEAARIRLDFGDFDDFEPPLCHIRTVADIITGQNDNPFLDTVGGWQRIYDGEEMPAWDSPDDVAYLRRMWSEAEPKIEEYEEFVAWASDYEHYHDRMQAVARALFYGEKEIGND